MPIKCCVPKCKSNYKGEVYTTVFQFPSQTRNPALREKWIRSIPRKDWAPSKRTVVCMKHFQKEEIITSEKFTDSKGIEQIVQRRPVLKHEAFPTIFPHSPSYSTTESVKKRKDPSKRAAEVQIRHDKAISELLESDLHKRSLSSESLEFQPCLESLPQVKEEPEAVEKYEDPLYPEGCSNQVCKDYTLCEDQTGLEKVEHSGPCEEMHIKDEHFDEVWTCPTNSQDDVQEIKCDSQQIKVEGQDTFSDTQSENTNYTEQIKEEVEGFKIMDGNIENTGEKKESRNMHLLMTPTESEGNGRIENRGNTIQEVEEGELRESGNAAVRHLVDTEDGFKNIPLGERRLILSTCIKPSENVITSQKVFKCSVRSEGSVSPYHNNVCGEEFVKHNNLITHEKTHAGEKPYKCDVCSKECGDSSCLKAHRKTHTEEKPFECNVCGKIFIYNYALKSHKKTHTVIKIYKCHFCGTEFNQRDELVAHERTHLEEKPLKCDVCGKEVTSESRLQTHIRTHTDDTPYYCDVCGKGLRSNFGLISHKKTHTAEKLYKCDVCGIKLNTKVKLHRHMRSHPEEKPNKCDVCGKRFNQYESLKKHKKIHGGEKPNKCNVCGKGFFKNCELKIHERKHTGEKPFICEVCGEGFIENGLLKIHQRKHTREKPYLCEVCGKGFVVNLELKVHQITHTGEKPYKCDVCGKGFIFNHVLNFHRGKHERDKLCSLRTLIGEKPYVCDVCTKGFVSKSKLNRHVRTHTGEKAYKCDVCDKGFVQDSSLIRHKRTHTGEKPFECNLCGRSFSQNSALDYHKTTHFKDNFEYKIKHTQEIKI